MSLRHAADSSLLGPFALLATVGMFVLSGCQGMAEEGEGSSVAASLSFADDGNVQGKATLGGKPASVLGIPSTLRDAITQLASAQKIAETLSALPYRMDASDLRSALEADPKGFVLDAMRGNPLEEDPSAETRDQIATYFSLGLVERWRAETSLTPAFGDQPDAATLANLHAVVGALLDGSVIMVQASWDPRTTVEDLTVGTVALDLEHGAVRVLAFPRD
jgi:hypothetical protein